MNLGKSSLMLVAREPANAMIHERRANESVERANGSAVRFDNLKERPREGSVALDIGSNLIISCGSDCDCDCSVILS